MEVEKKYELTNEEININGVTLYRIRSLRAFGAVKVGELGGYVEGHINLSHEGDAWVYGDARVYGDAKVYGNAEVSGKARVSGNAEVSGDALVKTLSDYIVFKNWWSSGRYFTWTRSNDMWRVGCFYGSGDELIAKAFKDSYESGVEYKRIVDYVESLKIK